MPTVLVYGDSNTHGTVPMRNLQSRQRHPKGVRWASAMAEALGPDFEIIEEGHGGRTTTHLDPLSMSNRNGADILPVLLESHRPIDLVVVMLGTNDLKAHLNLSALEVALGVEKLVMLIRGSECGGDHGPPEILLVSPPHITEMGIFADMFRGGAVKSQALASQFAALADRQNCAFFDAAMVAETDASEGIHFDAANHKSLGIAVADVVRTRFKQAKD